jgi:CRP-like cAMP-binding protein
MLIAIESQRIVPPCHWILNRRPISLAADQGVGAPKVTCMLGNHCQNRSSDLRCRTIYERMAALTPLSQGEQDLLLSVGAGPAIQWASRTFIDQPVGDFGAPRYIISGWAAHVRELSDGRRQLVQLLLPGDPLSPPFEAHQPQKILCLNQVQTVDGSAVRSASRDPDRFPGIAAAVELAAAKDRMLLIEQVIRLGRQTAYERIANLFVELHQRCSTVGLVHADSFTFPLTQESLGDLLGLSVVHVNRTLQIMRAESVIQLKHGRLALLNLPRLSDIAQFNSQVRSSSGRAGTPPRPTPATAPAFAPSAASMSSTAA